jgi:hypothetical protein
MRHFEFQLKVPDGRIVTADVRTESWRWPAAFSAACARVESDLGIPPDSGIICVGYRSVPDPFTAAA